MRRRTRILLAAGVLSITLLGASAVPAGAVVTLPPHFEEITLAEGFFVPTAVAWAPDGRMFVAQLWGRVRVVEDGTIQPDDLIDISDHVNVHGDRGLLGMAVDADFATNHHLYLLYVHEGGGDPSDEGPKTARLTRVVVNDDNTVANPDSPETVILGKDGSAPCPAPDNELDCISADASAHTIGTVRADPDGTLWVGSGDGSPTAANSAGALRAYDERTYNGKLMRIDRDGNGLPGHPFCTDDDDLTHVCTKLFAKGFRNPYRFSLRGGGLGPIVGDVGFDSQDEVDLVEPGGDYGWPCWEGTIHTPGWASNAACQSHYGPSPANPAVAPAWSYGNGPGAAVVGGPVYPGGAYPDEFDGDVLVGDYAQGWIKRLRIGSGTPSEKPFVGGAGPLDLQIAPNGNVAYTTAEGLSVHGRVAEVAYCPENCGPVALIGADRVFGNRPLRVNFDASDSFDWDGESLTYDWDFGDGSVHDARKKPAHTYDKDGVYTATLTVTDPHGRSATRSIHIWSANTPPVPKVEAPADGSGFTAGQPMTLKGSATDAEDGPVDAAKLEWRVLLRHKEHVHPFDGLSGATAAFTPAGDHEVDSWYEVTLLARDSQGLEATRTIRLYPRTVPVTLTSSPPGAPLGYGSASVVAPFATFSPLGLKTSVSAAPAFIRGDRTYAFDRWSDGGAVNHQLTVTGPAVHLVARYRDVTAPKDTTGPRLLFDPEQAGPRARKGRLAGSASDPAGVRRVDVAIRARRASKRGCRWWLVERGRLGHGRSSCDAPRWIRAKLLPGKAGVRWRAELGAAAPPRRYVAALRAVDGLGNLTRVKRVRMKVSR